MYVHVGYANFISIYVDGWAVIGSILQDFGRGRKGNENFHCTPNPEPSTYLGARRQTPHNHDMRECRWRLRCLSPRCVPFEEKLRESQA